MSVDTKRVSLREITSETVRAVTRLSVAESQKGFVAPNAVSLAQALFAPTAWYRAIYLADASWHSRHEDVALALQKLRNPASIEALERLALAQHEYLEYDEFFGLGRKCTWALADIGTPQAREALERLVSSENQIISAFAAKRLENWQHELHRKRGA